MTSEVEWTDEVPNEMGCYYWWRESPDYLAEPVWMLGRAPYGMTVPRVGRGGIEYAATMAGEWSRRRIRRPGEQGQSGAE